MIEVDKTILPGRKDPTRTRKATYSDVKFDQYGWTSVNDYMPMAFDLVYMRLNNGKMITGWQHDGIWEGLGLKEEDSVTKWKIKPLDKQ